MVQCFNMHDLRIFPCFIRMEQLYNYLSRAGSEGVYFELNKKVRRGLY